MRLPSNNPNVFLRDFRRVEIEADADEMLRRLIVECRSIEDEAERDVWIRAAEMSLRVAMTVAVFRGSWTITVEDLGWSMELVRWCTREFLTDLEEEMIEDVAIPELTKQFRREFASRKIMSLGQCNRFGERKAGERDYSKIEKALKHLVTCGDIFPFETPVVAGKQTTWFRSHTISDEEALKRWSSK